MPARMAMVNAGPMSAVKVSTLTDGMDGRGSDAGIAPKRLPIVSTSIPRRRTRMVVAMRATKGAGIFRLTRGQSSMIPSASADTMMVGRCAESMFAA